MRICYTPKDFRAETLATIETANGIIDEYAAQGYNYCLLGATDVQLADFFGVAESTSASGS